MGKNPNKGLVEHFRGTRLSMVVFLLAGAAVGIGVYYLFFQNHFKYENAVQMVENGEYYSALRQFEELGEYSDSEEQSYEILKQLVVTYFETEQYYNLCELMNIIDSSMADALFQDADINIHQVTSLGRAASQYGFELDHVGRLSFRSVSMEGIQPGSFALTDEERAQPKVIITEYDTWVGTVFGTVLVGQNTVENQAGRTIISYPSDSLIAKVNEVREHYSEAFPELELNMAGVLATERIPYSTVADIVELLDSSGYTEVEVQVAPSVMLSRCLPSPNPADNPPNRDSLEQTGSLTELVIETEDGLPSDSLIFPTLEEIHAAGISAGIEFEVEATGEAMDLGYRTLDEIRRKLNLIKMRMQYLYEDHLQSYPGSFGCITVRFVIDGTGQVDDVIVTSDLSLSLIQDRVRDAVLLLNYEPVQEETENVLVEANFTLIPPLEQS